MIVSGILDTGMSAKEAMERASDWWDRFGRHQLPKDFNTETKVKHRKAIPGHGFLGHPAVVLRTTETVIPAGLLEGKPWGELAQDEQRQVVKAWHHFFVRLPQQFGDTPTTVDQVLTIRCDSLGHPKATRDEETVYRGRTQTLAFEQAREAGWLISAEKDICPACVGREYHPEPEGVQ